jgi:mannitol 2-dehydrogenase
MARARQQGDDPLAFIRNRQLFGELSDNAEFARCYESCLKSFHSIGAYRTLQGINRPG